MCDGNCLKCGCCGDVVGVKRDTPKAKKIRRVKSEMAGFLLKEVYSEDASDECILDILKALKTQIENEIICFERGM